MNKIIDSFWNYLNGLPYLRSLFELQDRFSVEIFIVGGIIRDFLLNRVEHKNTVEIDFAVSGETKDIAKLFAYQIKGFFFVLDEENHTYRVILEKEKLYQFDFSSLRGSRIEEDLYLRDFTINSLAIDLKGIRDKRFFRVIDPYGGFKDIENKTIRIVSDLSLKDDPLRIIRAFTFFQELEFRIDSFTENSIKENIYFLKNVAGERITEQFVRIFESPFSYKAVDYMDRLGVFEAIFPIVKEMKGVEQGPYHHLDVWKHSLETLKELEIFLKQLYTHDSLGEKIKNYLEEKITGTRKRLFVVKLGALFHDLGKPRAKEITPEGKIRFIGHEKIGANLVIQIVERLKLSSREKNILTKLVQLHLRPGYLVDTKDISPRAKLRFFRAGEEESVSIILISLADKFATRGPLTTVNDRNEFKEYLLHLLKVYFYEKDLVKPPRLLDGNEVMKILNIPPGPIVGKILKALEEAQVEKKVINKSEAEEFIKEIFEEMREDE